MGSGKSKRGLSAPGGDPVKIPCPRCGEYFQKRGFSGHKQFSNCWRNGTREPSSNHPEGTPVAFDTPSSNPNFWKSAETQKQLDAACRLSEDEPVLVRVKGPKGCGKTELARQFAAQYQRPFWNEDFGLKEDALELLARREFVHGRGTITVPTMLTRALQTPGCVINMDEINRVQSDKALNSLFSLLDHRHESPVEGLGKVTVAAGVVIFATMNEGVGYIGTIDLDVALKDRGNVHIFLDYPPLDMKALIIHYSSGLNLGTSKLLAQVWEQVMRFPEVVKEGGVSTRAMLNTAKLIVKGGLSIRDALISGVGGSIDNRELVLQALQKVQPPKGGN